MNTPLSEVRVYHRTMWAELSYRVDRKSINATLGATYEQLANLVKPIQVVGTAPDAAKVSYEMAIAAVKTVSQWVGFLGQMVEALQRSQEADDSVLADMSQITFYRAKYHVMGDGKEPLTMVEASSNSPVGYLRMFTCEHRGQPRLVVKAFVTLAGGVNRAIYAAAPIIV